MRAAVSLFRRLRAAQPSPSPFTAYRPLSSTRLFSSSASPALRSHPPCAPSLRPLPYPRRPLTQRLPDPRRPSHLRTARRRPYSTATSQPPPNPPPPPQSLSLSQRLRKLSREYGWAAFGVYMALSALDFPFSFLAVRWLGTERIGRAEQAVTAWVKRATPVQIPEPWREWWRESMKGWKGEKERAGQVVAVGETGVGAEGYDHGVREAEAANRGEDASIWTQLALAYAIHKSFIFLRVPLAAAVTPKVVKTLRGWGWNIGKRRPKAERDAAKAVKAAAKARKE